MKRLLLLLLVASLWLFTGCRKQINDQKTGTSSTTANSTDNSPTSAYPKRYLVESGFVEYQMSGMRKGTETIYFDRWGWREAKYTNSELAIGGISQKENKLTLIDGEWIYNIDLDQRTGTKTKNPLLPQFIDAAKGRSMTEVGEEMLRNMGGEKGGTETIAGQTCDIWTIKSLGSKTCVWNGVTLRTELSTGGMQMVSNATRFQANASIPEDKLVIPGDVKVSDAPDVKRILEGMRDKTKGR